MSILNFTISHKGKLLGNCKYAVLSSHSTSFTRQFFFDRLYISEGFEVGDIIVVRVEFINKHQSELILVEFEMYVLEYKSVSSGTIIQGIIMPGVYPENYEQEVIDIFNIWQNGNEVDWKKLNTREKDVYNYCCGQWSGVSKELKLKKYMLDCSQISEEIDFYILLGETLIGKRGYFGNYFYTLDDCLTDLYVEGEDDVTLELTGCDVLKNIIGDTYFDNIIALFRRYRFNLVIR
jgi:hypothetical protein